MSLIVEVKQGKLRGRENTSVLTGQKYYTFSGIPYAKPPVGDLRFKDPQPHEKWEGIYDATYERDSCFQKNPFTQKWEGSEDCLYINVNTPEIPGEIKAPKAVMVFIHGGGYFFGSGSEKQYSADYLVPLDVILVTMNYRLHVLGFLNLGIPNYAGNAGLKDQSLALKWVKENIKQFGGDPNNITIFGESAGSAGVQYHIISPMSKGLFQKAIMESGICFGPGYKKELDPKDAVKDFSKRLGFTGKGYQELLEFLKKQPVKVLVDTYADMTTDIFKLHPAGFNLGSFSPSVEAIKDGAFLPASPEELLKNTAPLPIICGLTDKEGYIFVGSFSKDIVEHLKKDFSIIIKNNFDIVPEKLAEVSAQVKKYYLGDKEVGVETAEQLTDLCSDIMFFKIYEAIDFVMKSPMPPYVYEFDYDRKPGETFFKNPILPKNFKGACHAAELPCLFYAKNSLTPPPSHSDDLTVIKNITTLWANFAKTGTPSHGPTTWTPSTTSEPYYLKIDTNLELKKGKLYGERLQFLKNVLKPVIIAT